MNRLEKALAILGRLQPPQQEEKDRYFTTLDVQPRLRAGAKLDSLPTPEELISRNVSTQELASLFKEALKEYDIKLTEHQKMKEEKRKEAEARWTEQKSVWYKFGIGGISGIFGTLELSTGYDQSGLRIGEELKKLSITELNEILKRLDNGEVPTPLKNYGKQYIIDCRGWLLSVIRQKSNH